ncbi:MAG: ATP-binding cassette domain-containing protein [Muribaculaceae bacterium]
MQKIELHNVLPAVFAGSDDSGSEVWLRDVSFEKGRRYLISAESGTGKSSLCSYLYGYRTDYMGTIAFDGSDVLRLGVAEWCKVRSHHLAYLPQELRLFPELTALENVMLKNDITGYKSREEIVRLFEALGIADKLNSPVGRLSIGQQQRVAIIRTLCQPCDFVILDEPVSHLDSANNAIVGKLVSEEAARQGAGVISTSVGNNVMIKVDEELKL